MRKYGRQAVEIVTQVALFASGRAPRYLVGDKSFE